MFPVPGSPSEILPSLSAALLPRWLYVAGSSVVSIGKHKCSGTVRLQRLQYVQHVSCFLKDALGNFLKDASRTVFLTISVLLSR